MTDAQLHRGSLASWLWRPWGFVDVEADSMENRLEVAEGVFRIAVLPYHFLRSFMNILRPSTRSYLFDRGQHRVVGRGIHPLLLGRRFPDHRRGGNVRIVGLVDRGITQYEELPVSDHLVRVVPQHQ